MTATCGAPTKAGPPCRSALNLSPTTGKCLMHDPERIAARQAMHSAGGNASKVSKVKAKAADPKLVPKAPKSLEDAVQWSSWAMRAVAVGDMDARTGHEVGYLVARFVEGVSKRDLSREIAKLRAELDAAKANR